MSTRVFVFLLLFSSHYFSFSQNLVLNPGFEEFFLCPGSYNYSTEGKVAPGWFSPTKGTPDLFNQCSKGEAGVPINWAGNSKAYSGKGYAGIYAYLLTNKDYREYLQAELNTPLQKGGQYRVQFYFKLASNSKYSIDRIGFLLSDSSYRINNDRPFSIKPTYELIMPTAYGRSTGLWNKCWFIIDAKGGEQFLTIGNFSTNDKTRYHKLTFSKATEAMLNQVAYYFIDDVQVIRLDVPKPIIPTPRIEGYPEIKTNVVYVLKNVFFEFDSYQLIGTSFQELDKWYTVIQDRGAWKVQLTGHTDERGTDEYNLILSKQRVQSVADYLVKKGIAASRINVIGAGKSRPLSTGRDEAAHALNRRVEIEFLDN